MPEAHRLLGFILMQLGAPRRARDEYAKVANLGDDEAVLDTLRASYEAETPEWTVQARSRAAQAQLDPSIDVQVALNDLQARFPNDKLINEAVHLNSNTE